MTAPETTGMGPRALGIDIGGTGVKYGLVGIREGRLVTERRRTPTPQPATVAALTAVVKDAYASAEGVDLAGVGVAFPAVVRRGVALTAINIANEWQYTDVADHLGHALGREVAVLNDGDAAGLAEVRVGAGKGVEGVIVLVTLGTGVGTSLFVDGRLVPNLELGRVRVRGKLAGDRASNRARKERRLSWEAWAADVQELIVEIDRMVWADLVIIGGGVSAQAHRFLPFIAARPTIVPARLRNDAGIVGAALYAHERQCPGV